MKKQLTYLTYRICLLLPLFLLCIGTLQAQGLYSGGEADGYASAGFSVVLGDPVVDPGAPNVVLAPNTIAAGESFEIRLSGIRDQVAVTIYDVRGRRIAKEVLSGLEGSHTVRYSTAGWASARYIVDIRVDDTAIREQIYVGKAQ